MQIRTLWQSLNFRKRVTESLVFLVATGLIIYLARMESYLKQTTSGTTVGNRFLIFGITNFIILLLILIVYLVIRTSARILMARRSGGGSKLKSKLVLAFVGLSFIPTILLFVVSTGYINTSIVTWFNSQIEKSLNQSMEVVQETYRTAGARSLHFGRQVGGQVARRRLFTPEKRPHLMDLVQQLRHEYGVSRIELFGADGTLLTGGDITPPELDLFPLPTGGELQEVMAGRELNRFYSVGSADLIRGIVPVSVAGSIVGAVAVDFYVPQSLAGKVHGISRAYQDYRQASSLKNPIRNEFFLTLALITLVILFLSVWLGIYLANSLTTPIKELADATAKVAQGDLEVHLGEQGDDEIGLLVSSFNKMTDDLRASQQTLRRTNAELTLSNRELEERRRYMEIVLENVTAGVVSLSRDGLLTTVNKSAEALLGVRADEVIGTHFRQVTGPENMELAARMLDELGANPGETLRRQVTIPVNRNRVTLQVSVTALRNDRGEPVGTVAVLDDLTQLMRAQRMAAWREVARRIAHEIKNPLTPIQLSAQRLRRRYLKRFSEGDDVFDQCTSLIIRSVEELKTLVNEFNNFARLPAARPLPEELNSIIREACTLYGEAHQGIALTFMPDPSLPQILLDRDQIKRVLINLLDNAVAAVDGKGKIDISTSYNPELRLVTCEVADDGHGIAPEDRSRLFEPYFSTKVSGTGLGLAIVNTIITDHQGFVRVRDNDPCGTRFIIELPAG